MTASPLKRLWFDEHGFLRADVEPGYEVLGEYLSADLHGIDEAPYTDLRTLVTDGLETDASDDLVTDGFSVDVDGPTTTIQLLSRPSYRMTLSTEEFSAALDTYASHYENH